MTILYVAGKQPIKNSSFTLRIPGLVSQSDTDIFQVNPTLGASDVNHVGDGAWTGSLSSSPVAIGASSPSVEIDLTAGEMNYDEVIIWFRDLADSEWQDAGWLIYTVTACTVSDFDESADNVMLAASTHTGAVIPTVTSITNGVTLANDAITSAKYDESTAYPLASVDSGSTEVARTGADSDTLEDISDEIAAISTTATVAISGTVAAQVATGRLSIRSYHTFGQSITSTATSDLSSATKVWWAVKTNKIDTDNSAMVFVESGSGLTRYSGSAYTGASSNGSIAITGSSGDWSVALALEEAITASMSVHTGYYSEIKALVSNNTVAIWDGQANINQGIVQEIT